MCSPEEIHFIHEGMSHCSQYKSHTSIVCFEHLGFSPLGISDTNLCSLNPTAKWFFSHSLHEYMLQMSHNAREL